MTPALEFTCFVDDHTIEGNIQGHALTVHCNFIL